MNIIRFILILLGTLLASFGLLFIVYGFNFTYEYVSNAMFVIGVLIFFPSLIFITGAYEVFQGMGYASKLFLISDYKKQYPTFTDYKEDKKTTHKTTLFIELLIVSFLVMITAFILSRMVS